MRGTLSTFVRRGVVTRRAVTRGGGVPVCGIAGVIALSDRGPDPSVVEHMTRHLASRGGAAWGYYVDSRVGLGIACPGVVAPGRGDQVATNEERSVHVVLDGQIHNAPQVADGLLKAGHRFLTSTDAEVVAHAWEKYGERSLDLFTGIFALAIWDAQRRRLFLAVDRVGEKRLHYAVTDTWLVFASDINAVLVHPALKSEHELAMIPRCLTFNVDGHAAGFRSTTCLGPGREGRTGDSI